MPRDQLVLKTPASNMSTYTFNKHVIKHRFCPTCGMHPFGEGATPKGEPMAAINVRCLEGVDIAALKVKHFNGRDI